MPDFQTWVRRAVKGVRGTRSREYPLTPPGEAYPLDWRGHASRVDSPASGVRAPHPGAGTYLHPVATSFAGLALHQSMILDGAEYSSEIRQLAHALCSAQLPSGAWLYPVEVPEYGTPPGWVSGMAQGLAISFLLRAADLSAEEPRLELEGAIQRAHRVLLTSLSSGGCSDWDAEGRPFFEECPAEPAPFILNGAAFAIVGLYEFEARFGGLVATLAAQRLSRMLGGWDLGYWSSYDLVGRAPSSPDYHSLHISQLRLLASLFPSENFADYASRFESYRNHRANRLRAFVGIVAARLRLAPPKSAGAS